MSESTLAGQFCAHLHVEWHTRDDGNLTVGWWECAVCPQHFVPFTEDLIRTVAALTAENERLKAAMTEWAGMSGAVEIAISDLTNQSPWTALDVLRKARTFGDRARAALPSSRETTDGRTDPS